MENYCFFPHFACVTSHISNILDVISPPPEGRPPASSELPECAAPGCPGLIGVWAHDDADVEDDDGGL